MLVRSKDCPQPTAQCELRTLTIVFGLLVIVCVNLIGPDMEI